MYGTAYDATYYMVLRNMSVENIDSVDNNVSVENTDDISRYRKFILVATLVQYW